MDVRWLLLLLLAAIDPALANSEFNNDPYLAFRPPFARSLPVQIMLTGVVLTLVAVLFVHLLFTAQYHWPLAPVNYVLQLSGVTTLLISLIATIHVVLSATFQESERWPYMLSYIAVNVPPLDVSTAEAEWSIAEKATWLVMNASTSGLIQITHIQFLTILYPSRLEGRLIFTLLGPLAVVAAIMQLLPISGNPSVYTVANSIRNVCNATLSLLFTLALFIWGLLVNRKQAWRTEGGTPVFGCAALSLAVISTALNFLYVHKQEEFVWLPSLMWAVVLWQSFLAWWWWVGAGAGGASAALAFASEDERLEEKLRMEEKKEKRRREKREKKEEKKRKKAMKKHPAQPQNPSSPRPPLQRRPTDPSDTSNTSASASGGADSTTSTTNTSSLHTIPRLLPALLYRWYTSLRRAHNAAAQLQAAEHVERMRVLGREGVVVEGVGVGTLTQVVPTGGGGAGGEGRVGVVQMGNGTRSVRLDVEVEGWGWGWEGFGWRRRRRWVVGPEERDKMGDVVQRNKRRREGEGHEMQDMRGARPTSGDEEEEEDVEEEEDMYVSDGEAEAEARQDAMRRRRSSSSSNLRRRTSRTSTLNAPSSDTLTPRSTPTPTHSHSNSTSHSNPNANANATLQSPPPALRSRSPTSSLTSPSSPSSQSSSQSSSSSLPAPVTHHSPTTTNASSSSSSPSSSSYLPTVRPDSGARSRTGVTRVPGVPLPLLQTPERAASAAHSDPSAQTHRQGQALAPQQQQNQQQNQQQHQHAQAGAARPRSVWWWGPLWRWRLQDSTVYR